MEFGDNLKIKGFKRSDFSTMKTLAYILVAVSLFSCSEQEKKQNFVFILVDDLGWTDLGYSGSTFYETPNIDAFSSVSIQFTNAYAAASICSPSRASIMTGKHPARLNITDWIPGQNPKNRALLSPQDLDELPLQETTLPELLKANGYKTFFAGKWHLGGNGFYPEDQGFDINKGGHAKGSPPGGYYSPYKNPKLSDGAEGEYLTDRLTDESIHFLDSAGKEPFFLFLSYYTVHTPIQPSKKHIEYFQKKLEGMEEQEVIQKVEGNGNTNLNQVNAQYASMVYAMDENVGRLIDKLKAEGLYENTTIVFTSDNGGLSTYQSSIKRPAPTSVLPLRGGKGWLYEGGIRVPLLIKPANYSDGEKIIDTPTVGYDLYTTLLSMAGIDAGKNEALDGIKINAVFEDGELPANRSIFWHYPHYHGSGWTPGSAIRVGDWKLIEFHETNHVELFNLADDISETVDLSTKFPEKTQKLKEELENHKKAMNANKAIPNPEYIATKLF